MKRIIIAFLLLICINVAYSQDNQFEDMDLQEILNRAIEYSCGFNGVTIDTDKARDYFLYLTSQEGYYGTISKQALIEEKMVDCEKSHQYFKEIEDEVSKNKTEENSIFMNFLSRQYNTEYIERFPCTPKDDTKSLFWAKTSAGLGNADGQYLMGRAYLWGTSIIDIDIIEGLMWIKKSADGGHKTSMMVLGEAYFYGEFVQKNDKQALYWFKEAAKQGEGDAYYYIAIVNFNGGDGIEQNTEEAKKWCREGISLYNNTECCWLLSEILYDEQTNPERIEALEKAAEKDDKSAQAEIAKLHAFKLIPDADQLWGLQALKTLSDEGDPRAMSICGLLLYWGQYVQQNKEEGSMLIKSSAQEGDRFGIRLAKELNINY